MYQSCAITFTSLPLSATATPKGVLLPRFLPAYAAVENGRARADARRCARLPTTCLEATGHTPAGRPAIGEDRMAERIDGR